ncbi:hypothetical protein OYT13_11435 [Pandoraea sp. XJJ-1]|uniref:hypothetical protein n=1 Tax=Pandoraea sp. XJJ-1 TaxID=3002643 RepID=UPI00227F1CBC|nr:hypothetical protein [Pandoraea sp. XJJ-1]WAL84959.1 hypothetical protein OYT13_11435 [Pandoraea sp. XJJ-1]
MSPMMGMGAAGAAMYSNPYTAGIMGASQVLGQALQPAGPTVSGSSQTVNSWMDSSGWTVATGGSDARALPTVTSAAQSILTNPVVLVGLVFLVAAWKKHA